MIQPQTISEQMMYSTIKLVASNGSAGTGFFFNFSFSGNKEVPVIITNKHVVNNNNQEEVSCFLHVKNKNKIVNKGINITLKTKWYFHKNQDLCFCFIAPLFQEIKEKQKKDVFYVGITEDLIWDNVELEKLSMVEDITMVGYPNGLWDKNNNLPLFRRGITSSHPAIDFNNKNIGAVDVACFPGSSGSPIFVLNEDGYTDKKGNSYLGGKRIIFLGVLSKGPHFNAKGKLIIENIPTQQSVSALTPAMINLGYYIKATEILIFKSKIKKIMLKNSYA